MDEVKDDGNGGAWYGYSHYANKADAEYAQRNDLYREWEKDENRWRESSKNSSGGCLSTILGLIIIAAAIWIGINFGLKGIIVAAVLCFIVIPGTIGFVKGKKKNIMKNTQDAWNLFHQGQYTLALPKAELYANDNADAADLAGILYFYGQGCDENTEKAFKYFQLGKEGNYEAKAYLGYMLLNGIGCNENLELGKKYLKEAAAKNDIFACAKLGEYQLFETFGIEKNIEQAKRNLRLAAENGWVPAIYILGAIQYYGYEGIPINKEQGLVMIKEAAEKGYDVAIQDLESINSKGESI